MHLYAFECFFILANFFIVTPVRLFSYSSHLDSECLVWLRDNCSAESSRTLLTHPNHIKAPCVYQLTYLQVPSTAFSDTQTPPRLVL